MEKRNFPPEISAENPLDVPVVEHGAEDISCFIEWYFGEYQNEHGVPHPNIKSQQKIRVVKTLDAFLAENGLDVDALQEMAYAFFDNVDCDHNINLFATSGILKNRYYEALY